MNEHYKQVVESIISSLQQSEYWTTKTKQQTKYIFPLLCPECHRAEAWAYSADPWVIICNRQNHCGAHTKTLSLFPHISQNLEKTNQPTQNDPHRPARVYLQTRGLIRSLDGLRFEYWPNVRQTGCGAVMFPLGDGLYNGRLINPPHGEGKTHNIGSTAGKFWRHPGRQYDNSKPVYVTEGIVDALSLWEIGLQAIAILSASSDPHKFTLSEFPHLVFAFDPDEAGKKATRQWKARFPHARAILPSMGDWNDLLLSWPKDRLLEEFNKALPEFEFKGKLALAQAAQEYAAIYYQYHQRAAGLFPFKGCYYYSLVKSSKKEEEIQTYRVSNFTLEVDHYQVDTTHRDEPINRFHLKIKSKNGDITKCTVSANEISSPGNLTQVFLNRARVLWEGNKAESIELARLVAESKAPVVRQTQTIGYDQESEFYVFRDFAISKTGKMIRPNHKGFFEISRREQIRPVPYPTLNPVIGIKPQIIYELLYQAWGEKAMTAIAWVVSGWFVHQVKNKLGFFPFLSFWGDTQTGKTMLTRTLNALQCLDEEGLPMRKVNTGKGEIRKLAQTSSLFRALLEANTDNVRFDFDNLLTLYNDNPLQIKALKSNDIQTIEVPFLSSLLFVQNREPFQTKAQKERVISLQFKADQITPETTKAFNKLIQIQGSELAYFFPYIMQYRQDIEKKWFNAFQKAKIDLSEIADARIIENHAVILAFHRLLYDLLGQKYDLIDFIKELGKRKKKECRQRLESLADIFFDALNQIPAEEAWFKVLDSENKRLIVNLLEAVKKIKEDTGLILNLKDLQKSLAEHPAFIETNRLYRFTKQTESKPLRAWFFDSTQLF